MKSIRHKRILRALFRQYGAKSYSKVAIWLKGSKTYGDGSYNYKHTIKCSTCGK